MDLPAFRLVLLKLLEEGGDGAVRGRCWGSVRLAGSSDPVLLSDREFLGCQAFSTSLKLSRLNDRQDRAETLVFDDRTTGDVGVLVEDRIGQRLPLGEDRHATVVPLVDAHGLSAERHRVWAWLHEVRDALEVNGQVARQLALLLPREDRGEVLVVL